jgi:hypothetical protein
MMNQRYYGLSSSPARKLADIVTCRRRFDLETAVRRRCLSEIRHG